MNTNGSEIHETFQKRLRGVPKTFRDVPKIRLNFYVNEKQINLNSQNIPEKEEEAYLLHAQRLVNGKDEGLAVGIAFASLADATNALQLSKCGGISLRQRTVRNEVNQ